MLDDIPDNELEWTKEPIIGATLLMGGEDMIDSHMMPVNPYMYYRVAKHKPTGSLVILPTGRSVHEELFNEELKKSGRLN